MSLFSLYGQLLPGALLETLLMVFTSTFFALVIGLPLGCALTYTEKRRPLLHKALGFLVNVGRSFPFAVLMIALIPFTRWVVGTSLGTAAAVVPLSVAAAPLLARLFHNAFKEVDPKLVEAVSLMGAGTVALFTKVLIPESLSSLIRAVTMTAVSVTGYSAMAGLIGGGGLGQVALQYGYQRFNTPVLIATVVLLLVVVELLEQAGHYLAKRVSVA